MALKRRLAAGGTQAKQADNCSANKGSQKQHSSAKVKNAPLPEVVPPATSTWRCALAAVALALGLASAFSEWPIYL